MLIQDYGCNGRIPMSTNKQIKVGPSKNTPLVLFLMCMWWNFWEWTENNTRPSAPSFVLEILWHDTFTFRHQLAINQSSTPFLFSPFCFIYRCARAKFLWLKLKLSRERKWHLRVKGYTAVPTVSTCLHGQYRQNHRPNKNKGQKMTKFYQLQPKESRVDGGLCPSSWVSLSRSQTHAQNNDFFFFFFPSNL